MKKHTKTAIHAAKSAGRYILREYRKPDHKQNLKALREVVTEADLGADKRIAKILMDAHPSYGILSEESGLMDSDSDYQWIVDPIDGTNNFIAKIPIFAVSIALARKREVVSGIVYMPVTDELFVAEKSAGARLNGKKIRVTNRSKIRDATLLYAYGYGDKDRRDSMKIFSRLAVAAKVSRRLGSAAMELCWTAAGRSDASLLYGTRPWDSAAASLIVKEAGGRVTDWDGKPWTIDNPRLIATNGRINRELLKYI